MQILRAMSKKTLYFVIGFLVLMNIISIYFLMRPHDHPRHFRRPPSIIDVLNIGGGNVEKIKKMENIHFSEKGKLMDEVKATKRKIYALIGKKHAPQTLDSLLSILNSKHYQTERMTFVYFTELRTLVPSEKQKELDDFVLNVIANHPGPPRKK
jgi:hypothetical protein